eukprot:gb/GECH01008464.1/.p1 GENE.gb/GECH01008464.1/~~gb/GECH01008464.1/.p1  ORF type:complete len:133 (+),score=23.61 gb/GECH01008464.1/:1-399(+)
MWQRDILESHWIYQLIQKECQLEKKITLIEDDSLSSNIHAVVHTSQNIIGLSPTTIENKQLFLMYLTHELVHLYDYCKHKVNFSSPFNVACSEIRAFLEMQRQLFVFLLRIKIIFKTIILLEIQIKMNYGDL